MRWLLGFRPRPRLGAYDAPPSPLIAIGFVPSALAASRLRAFGACNFTHYVQGLSPPKQKVLVTSLLLKQYSRANGQLVDTRRSRHAVLRYVVK